MKAIADTGFVVAFLNKRDSYHSWAVRLASQADEPFLTCDAVLAEAAFQVEDSRTVLRLVQDGLLLPSFNALEHLDRLIELARRYADRKPDLADLCLIRLSELNPRHRVITVDVGDFRVYRRNKKDAIPLVHPPGAS
jgi:predicted nucleic acid-binding protein